MTKEALKLAIQLRDTASGYWTENEIPIIEKLIELLAQPEQEPVAWQFLQNGKWHNGTEFHSHRKNTEAASVPVRDLYTTPPQRTEPICPDCKAEVLYECVACSSNNYPPQRTEQEPDDIASIIACRNMLDAQPVPPKVNT